MFQMTDWHICPMDIVVCRAYIADLHTGLHREDGGMAQATRDEIRAFISAAETLLSPISLMPPLTGEERKLVEFYASSLAILFKEEEDSAERLA